jgi:CheY-like chemotaxis protein
MPGTSHYITNQPEKPETGESEQLVPEFGSKPSFKIVVPPLSMPVWTYYIYIIEMNERVLLIDRITAYPVISRMLTQKGFRVEAVGYPESGLQRLKMRNYDIIIVRDPPGTESWRLCGRIRAMTTAPLIVINSGANTETCARTIDIGADFFLRKPFGALELLARIKCLLLRTSAYQPLTVGPSIP